MKTILIVETTLDDLRNTKNKIVDSLTEKGILKQWSDDSVETKDNIIYFLKVVSVNDYMTELLSTIGKGYDEIKLDSVIKQIKSLLKTIKNENDEPENDSASSNNDKITSQSAEKGSNSYNTDEHDKIDVNDTYTPSAPKNDNN